MPIRLIVYSGPGIKPSYTVWRGVEILKTFKNRKAALAFMLAA